MQTPTSDLIPVLVVGTILMIVLTIFIFTFVIIYQKRMIKHQVQLQKVQSDKQRELMKAIFETQESERKRLAEDLHDSVGQVLSTIKLNIHRLDKQLSGEDEIKNLKHKELLNDTQHLVEDCIGEIRNIIRNILPPILTDFGIIEALGDLSNKVKNATGIQVNFHSDTSSIVLKKENEVLLYRIVQELFNNSIKHSGATEINLKFSKTSEKVLITFTDNGKGFILEEVRQGFGLKNMESRMQMLNGTIEVHSTPGKGTKSKIRLKLTH